MLFQKQFFKEDERNKIVKAISQAEAMTSGEIRLHVEATCKHENTLDRATEIFYQLKMDATEQKNGVLIYLAYSDHRFAIIGDKGINEVVPTNFWDSTKEVMRNHFKQEQYLEGVLFAINEIGLHLKQYFPLTSNDKNELTNEISEG